MSTAKAPAAPSGRICDKQTSRHLSNFIHPDQTGFLKGRFLGKNIRKALKMIHYTETKDIIGLILTIDF